MLRICIGAEGLFEIDAKAAEAGLRPGLWSRRDARRFRLKKPGLLNPAIP